MTRRPKFLRRSASRPEEMLDAALKLFLRDGYGATRVEDIAKMAGVSKGSIYRYFPSKHALMVGLVERAVAPISNKSLALAAATNTNPRDLIQTLIRSISHVISEAKNVAVPKLIIAEAARFPELAVLYRSQVIDAATPAFTALIERGMGEGYFRTFNAEMVVRSIVGPILAHMLLAEIFDVRPKGGLAMDEMIETHLNILFDGLCAPNANKTEGR